MRDCARRLAVAGAALAVAGAALAVAGAATRRRRAASWGPLAVAAVIVTSPCCC